MSVLLRLTLSGGAMILVVALLRALLHRKVSRSVWLVLWAIAVVRLLVPVFIPAPTSFLNLPMFRPAPAAAAVAAPSAARGPGAVFYIWLCGCVSVLIAVFGSHFRNRRRYAFAIPVTVELLQVPAHVRVCTMDGLRSPMTYGVFSPTILLPSDFPMEDRERLCHVLQHELLHIRNRDVLRKVLLFLAAAVHWFNPAVWLMVFLCCRDMEIRCDAQAVARLGGERVAYARTLVAVETGRMGSLLQVGFSHSATESRIRALARDRSRPYLSTAVCLALSAVLCAVFLTGQLAPAAAVLPTPAVQAPVSEAASQSAAVLPAPEVKAPAAVPAPEPEIAAPTEPAAAVSEAVPAAAPSVQPEAPAAPQEKPAVSPAPAAEEPQPAPTEPHRDSPNKELPTEVEMVQPSAAESEISTLSDFGSAAQAQAETGGDVYYAEEVAVSEIWIAEEAE